MRDVKKTYVLDTNVLIHDPESLFKFDEHVVAVPVEVLSELDRLKTQQGQLGASARRVNRAIRALFENRSLKDIVDGDPAKPGSLHADLRDGGELRIVINEALIRDHFSGQKAERLRAAFMQVYGPDHHITTPPNYLLPPTTATVHHVPLAPSHVCRTASPGLSPPRPPLHGKMLSRPFRPWAPKNGDSDTGLAPPHDPPLKPGEDRRNFCTGFAGLHVADLSAQTALAPLRAKAASDFVCL